MKSKTARGGVSFFIHVCLHLPNIQIAIQTAGLPYQSFADHSFLIGAATAAAKAGVEDSTTVNC